MKNTKTVKLQCIPLILSDTLGQVKWMAFWRFIKTSNFILKRMKIQKVESKLNSQCPLGNLCLRIFRLVKTGIISVFNFMLNMHVIPWIQKSFGSINTPRILHSYWILIQTTINSPLWISFNIHLLVSQLTLLLFWHLFWTKQSEILFKLFNK